MITGADIRKLLVYPITFHRVFSEVGGGVTAGLLLSQLFYLADKHADDDGWFYHSAKVLMDETTLTRTEFDNARKKLLERGIIDEARRGVPAQMHWRVNFDHLANLIAGNPQTEVQKRRAADRGKPAGKNAGNLQSLTDHETDQNKAINEGDGLPTFTEQQIDWKRRQLRRLVGEAEERRIYDHLTHVRETPGQILAALESAHYNLTRERRR